MYTSFYITNKDYLITASAITAHIRQTALGYAELSQNLYAKTTQQIKSLKFTCGNFLAAVEISTLNYNETTYNCKGMPVSKSKPQAHNIFTFFEILMTSYINIQR